MCDENPIQIRNGSKVLCFNVCFLLPDNFDGDCDDAVKCYLKYKRQKNIKNSLGSPSSLKMSNLTLGTIWQQFMMILKNGGRSHGYVSLAEHDDDNWQFKN